MTTTGWWWELPQPYNINFDGTVLWRVVCWMILIAFLATPIVFIMFTALITQYGKGVKADDMAQSNAIVDVDHRDHACVDVSNSGGMVSNGDVCDHKTTGSRR